MCTCISLTAAQHCFGRTLDIDICNNEAVVITPRRFSLAFRRAGTLHTHYAIIGMAHVANDTPLYYDAMNEHGLSMAGLNFPVSAVYQAEAEGLDNIAPFEVIPWILTQCRNTAEARKLLEHINIEDISFSDALPATPLHWMLADAESCLAVEATADGLHILENPSRVIANNPPLPQQLAHLAEFTHLTNAARQDAPPVAGLGLGSAGLPGDFTSPARFVRAAMLRQWTAPYAGDDPVWDLFRLLTAVSIPQGAVLTEEGRAHYTRYISCCCADGRYCYATPEDSTPTAVCLQHAELDGTALSVYPLLKDRQMRCQN